MPALQIISSRPLQGKTTVAVGLATAINASGTPVRLVRLGGDEAADLDAATFATLPFASTSGTAVDKAALTLPSSPDVTLIEAPAGESLPSEIPAVLVVRGEVTDAESALAASLGANLLGTIAVNVAPGEVESRARELTNAGLRPLTLITEDRILLAPNVSDIRHALEAETLYDGENDTEVVEEVLIGPVYADPARPHFRRFASKAVLAPYNKTDLLIAAIESQTACLVITGGGRPSPYVLDRVQGENTTVLLAPHETPLTVSELGEVWGVSRFHGDAKAARITDLLTSQLNISALLKRLS